MKLLRMKAETVEAAAVAARLRAVDHELVNLVGTANCMTLRAAGDLAAMQRRIRKIRRQIEAECGLLSGVGDYGS